MPIEHRRTSPHRLLIVDENEEIARLMLEGLRRECCNAGHMISGAGRCACETTCCMFIRSLRELHKIDLDGWDVVICASSLPDGSGLDALAYLRGLKPELCVMLTGEPGDEQLAAEAIRAGAADFLVTTGGELRTLSLALEKCIAHQRIRHENDRLHRDLSNSLSETAVKNRQLQALIQQLETLSRTDELTGLCNRRWLNIMLERAWAESLRHGLPLAFAMLDLDGFKAINDRHGHQRGDEALRLAAKVVRANCREVDLPARYGGDEFCILMPHTRPREAMRVARRIIAAFEKACAKGVEATAGLGMSIGLAHISVSDPASLVQLVAHADEALYAAKASGKNCVVMRRKLSVHRARAGSPSFPSGQEPN